MSLRDYTAATPEQVVCIRKSLLSLKSHDRIANTIIGEGLIAIDEIEAVWDLDPDSDTPESNILHGRLSAVINILQTLGKLPSELAYLSAEGGTEEEIL